MTQSINILYIIMPFFIMTATSQTLSNPTKFLNNFNTQNTLNNPIKNYIRGVNLGGWFIPEYWMVDFYAGTDFKDMCSFGSSDRLEADRRIRQHLATWITDDEYRYMHENDINTIRLPIGYWNVMNDPYDIYFPIDPNLSIEYINQAFDYCEKYDISIILDLHGVPGSQNGNDHSGCGNGIVGWNTPMNINFTLQAIESIVNLFGHRKNLLAIELMNEPSASLEKNNHSDLLSFYQNAYKIIRRKSYSVLVAFNVLYSEYYDIWDHELTLEQGYHGIITDWHLYDCFGDQNLTTEQHIQNAENWGDMIKKHTIYHPVYVGEWSLATGMNPGGQAFADAQEASFANGIGYHFWSLKLAQSKNNPEWSFHAAIDAGYKI